MTDVLRLLFSVGLPWIVGALWTRALLWRDPDHGFAISIGYGYLMGLTAVTLLLRSLDALAVRWSIAWVSLPIVALACGALVRLHLRNPLTNFRDLGRRATEALGTMPAATWAIFYLLVALTVVRVIALSLDVVWTPLLTYDAWAQWASKARVWYAYGSMQPFVSTAAWPSAPGTMHFTDTNPHYPATVPLFQVWTAICLGRWDESLVNMPWAASFISLGIAFYAQTRRLGFSAIKSMFLTYLLLSLPFLTVHVALAGMADVFVAIAYGLAAMALWQWTVGRRRSDAILALVMAVICATLKQEGLIWMLTLLPGLVVAVNRRIGLAIVVVGASAAVLFLAFAPADFRIFNYALHIHIENVSLPLYEHMFVMDNWHLLWYAATALIAVNYRLLLEETLAPMTVTMLAAAGVVIVAFFFSSASGGVDEESLTNRLLLHIVPALVFYLAFILRERSRRTAAGTAELFDTAKPAA
jgi:hypothetical protein